MAGINLRNEALKFVRHVQATESPTHFVPKAQGLAVPVGQEMTMAERLVFTEAVRALYPTEEDPHRTLAELLRAMEQVEDEEIQKSEAYAKACILLIGHADLFHRFERFLNDSEIPDWRRRVRGKLLGEMDALVTLCKSTIQTIKENPKNLTAIQLDCIERLYFSEIDDPVEINQLVTNLKVEPDRYRRYVLPTLRAKPEMLENMYAFVSEYFAGVLTRAGVPLYMAAANPLQRFFLVSFRCFISE